MQFAKFIQPLSIAAAALLTISCSSKKNENIAIEYYIKSKLKEHATDGAILHGMEIKRDKHGISGMMEIEQWSDPAPLKSAGKILLYQKYKSIIFINEDKNNYNVYIPNGPFSCEFAINKPDIQRLAITTDVLNIAKNPIYNEAMEQSAWFDQSTQKLPLTNDDRYLKLRPVGRFVFGIPIPFFNTKWKYAGRINHRAVPVDILSEYCIDDKLQGSHGILTNDYNGDTQIDLAFSGVYLDENNKHGVFVAIITNVTNPALKNVEFLQSHEKTDGIGYLQIESISQLIEGKYVPGIRYKFNDTYYDILWSKELNKFVSTIGEPDMGT